MSETRFYTLKLIDQNSGEHYQIWPWQDSLQVKKNQNSSQVEANYPLTFFDASGELRPDLKLVLSAEFDDWSQTIPLKYRQWVGQLAGLQTDMPQLLILRLMKHHRTFNAWIEQLAKAQDGAYLRLMLTLANLNNHPLPILENWLLSLPGQARHTLLSRLTNTQLTATQVKKTRKLILDSLDWQPENIHLFLNSLNDPDFKNVLQSASQIRLGALPYLHTLPRWLWIGKLWQMLSQLQNRPLTNVIPPAVLEAKPSQQKAIVASFKTLQSPYDLENKLVKLVDKLVEFIDFPSPPFDGDAILQPICDAQALKAEGQTMQHCVGGYVSSVVSNKSFFYHWRGNEQLPMKLTLQLTPFAKSSQWQLYEALGFQNQPILEADWNTLRQHIANLNLPWGYLLVKTAIAGLEYNEYQNIFSQLKREMALNIEHEIDNPHDPNALRIETPQGHKLGYVPKSEQAKLLPYLKTRAQIHCRLNYLKPHYATVNIYLAPTVSITSTKPNRPANI